MTHEEIYIKETGDKKPEELLYKNIGIYRIELNHWYKRFSTWLSQRLERAEKENKLAGIKK